MAPSFVLRDHRGLISCLVFPQSRPLPSARGEQLELELRVWQQLSPPTIGPTSYGPVAAILPAATHDSTSVKLTASEGQVCLSFYAPTNALPSAGEVQQPTVRFHRYLPPPTASPSRNAAPRTFATPTGLFFHGVKKTKASPTRSKAMQQSAGVSSLAKTARGKRSLQAAKKQAEVSLDEAKAQAKKDKNKKKKAQKKVTAEAGAGPKRKSGAVGDASPGKRRRVESDEEDDEDDEEGSFHTAQGTPDDGFALDAPDDQPPPIDDDQAAASSWDTPPTYGRRAQAHAETKRRKKTRILATDAVLPLDQEDSSESDATRARVEQRIASRRLPPPTAEPQRSNTRPIRTNSRVQADIDQQGKQRRLNIDEGLIDQLIPKMRATKTRGAIRAARHDAVPVDWFRRSGIKHLTDEGVESMRRRATGGGRSSSGSLAAMDAMVRVEMRGHVILVKWKLLERYYRGRVSAIELRRYGCGLGDAEHARFYKARCRSFAPFFCRTREQFQQLHETQRHLDAHNCHTPRTYLVVVVFEDVAGRPQIALYVGSACEQSVAERQSQHDAKMLEMKEAEAAKDRRKMLALEAEQPGLYRRGVLDHWHFTLTQMAEGLVGAAAQAKWLEKLAEKLVGKKLGRLGETPLGPRQIVRMVTAVDELIGAALFASVKGIGFPMVTELNGARYSSKREYYEKANAVVPAIGFADLRWQALGSTPHLTFVAPQEPPKLPRSEWTKRAMQRFNILSHGSTVSSPAMSHLASSPVTASLASPLVARLLNAPATPAASIASQHVQDALFAAGIDADDPTLIDMIDVREVEDGCAVPLDTDWVKYRPRNEGDAKSKSSNDGASDEATATAPGSHATIAFDSQDGGQRCSVQLVSTGKVCKEPYTVFRPSAFSQEERRRLRDQLVVPSREGLPCVVDERGHVVVEVLGRSFTLDDGGSRGRLTPHDVPVIVIDDSDDDDEYINESEQVLLNDPVTEKDEPRHRCYKKGTLRGATANGHCVYSVLARILEMRGVDLRRLLFFAIKPDDPRIRQKRAKIFPHGVVPRVRAWKLFAKACCKDYHKDEELLFEMPRLIHRRIAVIDMEDEEGKPVVLSFLGRRLWLLEASHRRRLQSRPCPRLSP